MQVAHAVVGYHICSLLDMVEGCCASCFVAKTDFVSQAKRPNAVNIKSLHLSTQQ